MNHPKEAEVLSVAAGDTHDLIKAYNVYACPASYRFRPFRYITFRNKGGGEMEALFEVENCVEFNLSDPDLKDTINHSLPPEYVNRIINYVNDHFLDWILPYRGKYRFYLLRPDNKIELKHRPKPAVNNAGARYYALSELLNGEKIVKVESQQ